MSSSTQMPDTDKNVVIYTPLPQMFNKWKQILATFILADLRKMAELFFPIIRNREASFSQDDSGIPLPEQVTRVANGKSLTLKSDFIAFMAFFLSDRRNFRLYFNTFSAQEKQIWETVVREYFISENQINELARSNWVQPVKHSWGYYERTISDRLKWFDSCTCKLPGKDYYGFYKKGLYFTLKKDIFNLVCPYFSLPPVTFLLDALPEHHGLQPFCAEEDILLELPLLDSLYHSGTIHTSKPKASFSTLKKVLKRNHIKEFFPSEKDNTTCLLRTYLILSCYMLSRTAKQEKNTGLAEERLRLILHAALRFTEQSLPILLPHLSGLQKKAIQESNGRRLAEVLTGFLEASDGKWISVDLLCDTILSSPDHHTLCKMFAPSTFDKMELKNHKLEHVVFIDRVYREVTVPYLKAFLFLMGALGGLELMYSDPKPQDLSYFEGLKYVRLTELGNYMLGKTQTYNRTKPVESTKRFELDTDKMLIRVTNERYEALLSEIAVPVGNNRFRVSHESFLKNCNNKKDIADKISFFKTHVSNDLPPNWKDFLGCLATRLDSIKPAGSSYHIYRLCKEDKELLRLVSTDPVIRAHSLRAEGFLLLVEPAHLKVVSARLKEAGYLLEEGFKTSGRF